MRAEWREHIDELTERYRTLRAGVADAQRRIAELTATARDADGRITVTVDERGRLTSVQLDQSAARSLPVDELGALIVAASRAAAAQIDAQREALLAPAIPADIRERLAEARDDTGRLDVTRIFGDPREHTGE